MARIRSLKPEFWDDRKLARSVSRDARMLYMGLWNQADEHCRLNGDAIWIKGRVFPYDDDVLPDDIDAMLDQLEAGGWVQRYDVDSDPYLYLPKLAKHQRLEPAKVESRLPAPPAQAEPRPRADTDANRSAPRADESAQDADESSLLYVAGVMEQGSGSKGHGGRARGARLDPNWTPSQQLIESMRAEGIPDHLARRELPKFRDYWAAKTGKDATKLDWDATWRNWLRRAAEQSPGSSPPTNGVGRGTAKAQGWLTVDQEFEPTQRAIEGRTA